MEITRELNKEFLIYYYSIYYYMLVYTLQYITYSKVHVLFISLLYIYYEDNIL